MNRSQLRSRLRLTLSDPDAWPEASLNGLIAAAFSDLGAYLLQPVDAILAGAGGVNEISLPSGVYTVLMVEYPDGQLPPSGLPRRHRYSPVFAVEPAYDLDSPLTTVFLSVAPGLGEGARARCLVVPSAPADDAADLGLATDRLALIEAHVAWQALRARLIQAASAAPARPELIAPLHAAAQMAETVYQARLAAVSAPASLPGWSNAWPFDRVY
jgi:hypothetical protein